MKAKSSPEGIRDSAASILNLKNYYGPNRQRERERERKSVGCPSNGTWINERASWPTVSESGKKMNSKNDRLLAEKDTRKKS